MNSKKGRAGKRKKGGVAQRGSSAPSGAINIPTSQLKKGSEKQKEEVVNAKQKQEAAASVSEVAPSGGKKVEAKKTATQQTHSLPKDSDTKANAAQISNTKSNSGT